MGQISRHYVFKGFQDSKEFQEYMQILLEWEGESAAAESQLESATGQATAASLSAEAEELQKAIGEVIASAVSVKEF